MAPIVVLLYHRIADDDEPETTRPRVFAEHLAVLQDEGFRPLRPAQFVAALERGADVGPRRYLLSFDDGIVGIERGVEAMTRVGAGGLSFLISGKVGTPGYVDWASSRRLREQAGFEFASHTHSHERWPLDAASVEALRADLRESRARLHGELGPSDFAAHLAWPWGRCSPAFETAARDEGYRWQYLVQRCAVSRLGQTERLPRACMDGVATPTFRRWLLTLASPGTSTLARWSTGAVRRWRHGMAY